MQCSGLLGWGVWWPGKEIGGRTETGDSREASAGSWEGRGGLAWKQRVRDLVVGGGRWRWKGAESRSLNQHCLLQSLGPLAWSGGQRQCWAEATDIRVLVGSQEDGLVFL